MLVLRSVAGGGGGVSLKSVDLQIRLFLTLCLYEPGSKLLVLGMVIPPLIGNPYNGYINPYYWVDDHPLLYGNIGSLDDPSTYRISFVHV